METPILRTGFESDSHQVVDLALVDKVLPLLWVLDDVPRHARREEPPRHQLRQPIQGQVGEQARVRQVVLVPENNLHNNIL